MQQNSFSQGSRRGYLTRFWFQFWSKENSVEQEVSTYLYNVLTMERSKFFIAGFLWESQLIISISLRHLRHWSIQHCRTVWGHFMNATCNIDHQFNIIGIYWCPKKKKNPKQRMSLIYCHWSSFTLQWQKNSKIPTAC